MSFRLADYRRLLADLHSAGRKPQRVADALRAPSPNAAIVRHDVDRWPAQAIRMAELEREVSVRSTYYFRCDARGQFPVTACQRINALGHEIGYHYEDLSRHRGDLEQARLHFARNLATLRTIAPCSTVSMHGSPLSREDNRQLLGEKELRNAQLLGDASVSLHSHQPIYFTDAGGAWNDARVNFRDRIGEMPSGVNPLDSTSLLSFLAAHPQRPVYFNLHPERWSATPLQFALSNVLDGGARAIKAVLRMTRR
jgi:hypothetical protein